jgi:lipopolysaccharide/colanic/teichoic acid biosynthesis glycosyltransferase
MQFQQIVPGHDIHSKSGNTPPCEDFPRWKRILDVTCILLTLPVWLPIVFLIVLWIKLVSTGPVFFRQERIGYRANRFMILKFRTMKCNVETAMHELHLEQLIQTDRPMTKLDASGDPRIMRGGRLLRATGLDELPQLINVLRGEMSLVGPRPCTPKEFQRYQPWQRQRVNAAPGLTGYWQVNGKNKTTFTEMIDLDIFYTKNMSLRLDLAIILKTVPAILGQVLDARGAVRTARRSDRSMVGQRSRQCSQ